MYLYVYVIFSFLLLIKTDLHKYYAMQLISISIIKILLSNFNFIDSNNKFEMMYTDYNVNKYCYVNVTRQLLFGGRVKVP